MARAARPFGQSDVFVAASERRNARRDFSSASSEFKLIFDSANLQTIDHKHESALEKRRGTTLRK
jgi:hypothetical protein